MDAEGVDTREGRRYVTAAEAIARGGGAGGSESGVGSPSGSGWVGETEFNPFKKRDEKDVGTLDSCLFDCYACFFPRSFFVHVYL